MFPFLIFATVVFLPIFAKADSPYCGVTALPQVVVSAQVDEPRFDFSMTKEQLKAHFGAVNLPDARFYHVDLERDALLGGEIAVNHSVRYLDGKTKDGKQGCVWFDRVNVTLESRPVIYMASEYKKEACAFKELVTHELKHIDADRAILDAHAEKIRDGLKFAFAMPGDFAVGPVPVSVMKDSRESLKIAVEGALRALFDSMMRERMDVQGRIDNIREYVRLSKACG